VNDALVNLSMLDSITRGGGRKVVPVRSTFADIMFCAIASANNGSSTGKSVRSQLYPPAVQNVNPVSPTTGVEAGLATIDGAGLLFSEC